MEKRVLLAIVLSFVVLYGYQAMFPPPEPVKPAPAAQGPGAPAAATPAPGAAAGTTTPADTPALEQAPSASPVVADTEERDIAFENGSVRAVFSTRGGVLKSWRLKKYQNAAKEPLELVPHDAPAGLPKPFTLAVKDAGVSKTLAQALYRPSATAVDATSAPQTLVFDYQDASGLEVRKEFGFHPDSPYVVHLTTSVKRGTETMVPTVQWGPAIGSNLEVNTSGYNAPPRPIYYTEGDVERIGASDVAEVADQQGSYGFAGVDDHYFMSAAVDVKQPLRLQFQVVPMAAKDPAEDPPPPYISWAATPAAPPSGAAAFFFGPKDYDVLRAVSPDLTRAIDFGMFSWLVVPLLRALKWLNVYIGNYGWSIIALTVLINVVMFPLRHKSVVSMRRMQEIQPEVKAIQDRYSKLKMTDPARQNMNKEMMQLYKERGVNPASGCVPMLLTLPVLFAFYAMLSVAIELRGAPFIGWIKDLSVYDPLFITPVLMGATQFIQTKMTPSTADPTQQKVMMLMPLMFMFMFIWAPSGLVLYWTVSNLWAIGQQAVTNRMIGPAVVRTVRPPAERRVKNAGGGKSAAAKERK